jgi:hypothetical protein
MILKEFSQKTTTRKRRIFGAVHSLTRHLPEQEKASQNAEFKALFWARMS